VAVLGNCSVVVATASVRRQRCYSQLIQAGAVHLHDAQLQLHPLAMHGSMRMELTTSWHTATPS